MASEREHSFPPWMAERRAALGLSLAKLGELAGLSAAAVQKVERGGNPTINTFERLCAALEVTPADYYGRPAAKETRGCYVGMPGYLKLCQFAEVLREAFPGGHVFLVGSALEHQNWRDIDVRLMLSDESFAKLIGPFTKPRYANPRWNAMCVAFSALGRDMTGLPIDFQIDQQTAANVENKGKPRSAVASGNGPRCIGQIDHHTGEKVGDWWEALA